MNLRFARWLTAPVILVVACGMYRAAQGPEPPDLVLVRDRPWTINPLQDDPRVVTNEQLHAVLARVRLPIGSPDTNKIIHALRLWGPSADFGKKYWSGAAMRDYLTNDVAYRTHAGEGAPPLLTWALDGTAVRPARQGDPHVATGSVHVDDLLATLGEIGMPLDAHLETREGTMTVRQLLTRAMRRFHYSQAEYEWSAISYARYVFPTLSWRNDHGQKIDVDGLIDELVRRPLRQGVCAGTHRVEALVVLLRADDQARVLKPAERRRIIEHLRRVADLLTASQHAQGYWSKNWPEGAASLTEENPPLADRILATGHHLEWLALAPPEVQPPRESIVRAAQWLVRAMQEVDDRSLDIEYGPFSHAARALSLWRGSEAFTAWRMTMPASRPPAKGGFQRSK
ncbi:MAG: hypothetical protein K2Y37_11150 [Pirellulales bacterium]|nr:hypothetical protein [Pirellulales bacterium]